MIRTLSPTLAAALLLIVSFALGQTPERPPIQVEADPHQPPVLVEKNDQIRQAPLKVGIVVSQGSAKTLNAADRPYGLAPTQMFVAELHDSNFEMIPVIEKDTERQAPTSEVLEAAFSDKAPIQITDARALRKLDVLVVIYAPTLQPEALDAIEAAVSDGLPLLIGSSIGFLNPGFTEQVSRLHGVKNGRFAWNRIKQDAVIARAHPLLGDLNVGKHFYLKGNGAVGGLKEGEALIEVVDPELVNGKDEDPVTLDPPNIYSPLHLGKLQKGRVLTIGWAMYDPPPKELQNATGNHFYIRCLQYLAGRELE